MSQKYYRSVLSGHTFDELWRIIDGNILLFLVASVMKILRINPAEDLAQMHADAMVVVDPAKLSRVTVDDMADMRDECDMAGLKLERIYSTPFLSNMTGHGFVYSSSGTTTLNQVLYSRSEAGTQTIKMIHFGCISFMQNGDLLITTNQRCLTNNPARYKSEYFRGQSVRFILDRHQQRLSESKIPARTLTSETIEAELVKQHNEMIEHGIFRGTLRLMTDGEVAALMRKLRIPSSAANV